MMVGAKFDVPLMVTPSSLRGSNLGVSAPMLANFEAYFQILVEAAAFENQLLLVCPRRERRFLP